MARPTASNPRRTAASRSGTKSAAARATKPRATAAAARTSPKAAAALPARRVGARGGRGGRGGRSRSRSGGRRYAALEGGAASWADWLKYMPSAATLQKAANVTAAVTAAASAHKGGDHHAAAKHLVAALQNASKGTSLEASSSDLAHENVVGTLAAFSAALAPTPAASLTPSAGAATAAAAGVPTVLHA